MCRGTGRLVYSHVYVCIGMCLKVNAEIFVGWCVDLWGQQLFVNCESVNSLSKVTATTNQPGGPGHPYNLDKNPEVNVIILRTYWSEQCISTLLGIVNYTIPYRNFYSNVYQFYNHLPCLHLRSCQKFIVFHFCKFTFSLFQKQS